MKKLRFVTVILLIALISLCSIGCTKKPSKPTCQHDYESEYVEATCKSHAYVVYTCKLCDDTYSLDIGDAYGPHVGTDTCSECGKSFWTMMFDFLKKHGEPNESLGYMYAEYYDGTYASFAMEDTDSFSVYARRTQSGETADVVAIFEKGSISNATYMFSFMGYKMFGYVYPATFSMNSTTLTYLTSTFPSNATYSARSVACTTLQLALSFVAIVLEDYDAEFSLKNFGLKF